MFAQSTAVVGYEVASNGAEDAPCVGVPDVGPLVGAVLAAGVQAAPTSAKLAIKVAILGIRAEGRVMLALLHSYPAPIGTLVPEIAG
jgi:hypothetical protein